MDVRHAAAGSAARPVRKHKGSASASLPGPRTHTHIKRSLSLRRQARETSSPALDLQDVPSRPKSTSGHRHVPTPTSIPVPRRQESRTLLTPVDPSRGVDAMPLWNSPSNSSAGPAQTRHGKSGGISSVLKKMFHRKSRDGSGRQYATPNPYTSHHAYHQSESYAIPVARTPVIEDDGYQVPVAASARPVRSIEDFIPDRAPRRLPFPMNINAREASIHSQRPKTSGSNRSIQRRATLPSIVHTVDPDLDQAEQEQLDRAESDPISRRTDAEVGPEMQSEIGMAIPSSIRGRDRRSKSAGDLFRLAQEEAAEAQGRRRSEELEYWRQSFTPSFADNVSRFIARGGTLPSVSGSAIGGDKVTDERALHHRAERSMHVDSYASIDQDVDPARLSLATELDEPYTPVFNKRLSLLENNMQDITATLQGLAGRAYQSTMMQISPQSTRTRNTNIDDALPSPVRIGLPANPRDTLANRMSRQTLQDTGGQPQSSQARKDSFLPSPNPDSISRMIDSQFASHPTMTPHRERPTSSFSPQSLNLSPSKSSPHLRGASKASARPAPAFDEVLEGVSGEDEVITTASIYTHLAPIYSALRYERQQRKNLEAQVDILAKQVSDLALLLHRQSHQSLPPQDRDLASPTLLQSRTIQQSATTRSPTLIQIAPLRQATGQNLEPEVTIPRSDAPSSSIYRTLGGSSTEPLATLYPHFEQGSTSKPYHDLPDSYQQQVRESRWSGYSDQTQSSSLVGERGHDFDDDTGEAQIEKHVQVLQGRFSPTTSRIAPAQQQSRSKAQPAPLLYGSPTSPVKQAQPSRLPRSSPPRPKTSSAPTPHPIDTTALAGTPQRRKLSPTSATSGSPTPKKQSPPLKKQSPPLKKKSPEARLRGMSNKSIRPPTPPRPADRSVQAQGSTRAPSSLGSPLERWTTPVEEGYQSALGSPMVEKPGPVPLIIAGELDFSGSREGMKGKGREMVARNRGTQEGWVHADNLGTLSSPDLRSDEDEIF